MQAAEPGRIRVDRTNVAAPVGGRVVSVDALRGFDMFWIIGADALVGALEKMGQGNAFIGGVAKQLEHVEWAGFRFYDLIFPLFVFIVGVSITLSLPKRIAAAGKSGALWQVARRAAIIYVLGILGYTGISNGIDQVRWLGVLQRIALCYLFASIAFIYLKPRSLVGLCGGLLAGYWAVMQFVPVPGVGAGNFEEGKNLANYIDAHFLGGYKWDGEHDPEGLLSTLPAICTALLGIFAGLLLTNSELSARQKTKRLLLFGVAGVAAGWLWSWQFPIIKKLWTSSFVLLAGGWSAMLLGIFYWVIDGKGYARWATPFLWIGTNAITIYMAVHIVNMKGLSARIAGGDVKNFLEGIWPGLGELGLAVVSLGLALLFCRFLYQRKIFLRV